MSGPPRAHPRHPHVTLVPHHSEVVAVIESLLVVGGIAVLLLTFADAIVTTLVPGGGGGPLTSPIARGTWWVARKVGRSPGSWLRKAAGPASAILTAVTWLVALWIGWTLLFSVDPATVVDGTTGDPADLWTRIYFVGFSLFTLGTGDQVPDGTTWQLLSVFVSASGLALTTLAITYFIPIVTAVAERRQQAKRIGGLGDDAQAIVVTGWTGEGFDPLTDLLPDLADELLLSAERHSTYPILACFHSRRRVQDPQIQLVAIDEAVTLLRYAVDRDQVAVPRLPLQLLRRAVDEHLERDVPPGGVDELPEAALLDLAPLRDAGIPTVDDATFDTAVAAEQDRRRRLVALAASTGWDWREVLRLRPDPDGQRP